MISTKGRYAMRVMADLAEHIGETVPLSDIAKRQEISLKYLEAIVSALSRAGLIESQRGKSGGYRLNRKPEEYTAREILEVTEGGLVPVNCACLTKGEECKRSGPCPSLPVWQKLDKLIYDYLDSVSLSDLISK